jgi:hypothetical protein
LRTSWTSRRRAARHAGARGLGDEPLEPNGVHRLAIEPQLIAATVGHDLRAGLLGKQLAELRYVELHHLGRARGRLLAPQTLDQPIARDGEVRVQRERGQQRPLLRSAKPQPPPTELELDRTENTYLHLRTPLAPA